MSAASPNALADIQAALDEFQADLDEPYRMTPAGMWACSKSEEVYDLLRRMDLRRYRSFADVGSGDGRAVLIASLFMPATGIEADPTLVEAARSIARRLGLTQAKFVCDDCRRVDLAAYDLLFIYPDKPLEWLVTKLPDDWSGNLLVYGSYFQPAGMAHIDTIQAGHSKCTLWEK